MLNYSLKRLLSAVPTLFLLITFAFFLIRIAPGGPFDSDRALPLQYLRYMWQIVRLDLGPSFHYLDWTVNDLIVQGAPVSFALGGLALLLALDRKSTRLNSSHS